MSSKNEENGSFSWFIAPEEEGEEKKAHPALN